MIGCIAVGLTLFAACGVSLYRRRKAAEIEIALRYQEQPVQEEAETDPAEQLAEQLDLSQSRVSWKGKKYRRNTYMKAILCMGVDRSNEMTETKEAGEAGQADGIFLICQDTVRNELKILMIPRDTITEIQVCDENGQVQETVEDHLLIAYALGDGREQSCQNTVQTVSRLFFGLPIDSYMATDTVVISQLNDAIGGVTVTIPTDGMEKRDPAFVKGATVTLHGSQAESFVRYRDITVDHSAIYRMNQQKEYITQFFAALQKLSREDSQIVNHLFSLIQNYMVTDMEKGQYMKIALDALLSSDLQGDDFYIVPGKSVTTEQFDRYYIDEDAMTDVLLELFYHEEM